MDVSGQEDLEVNADEDLVRRMIMNLLENAVRHAPSGTRVNVGMTRGSGDIQVTVVLKKVSVGTEVNIVQEGIPDVIPPEACYLGWQESLRNLARLVEPEINQ